MKTPVSSIILVLVGSFIGSFGAVFLKAGSAMLRRNFRSFLLNWKLMAGIFFYVLSSVFFVMGVKKGELTILYPLVSLGYVWTLLWARVFFKEPLTTAKFVGLATIMCGIVLLNLGNR
jgi:multidrug transporter EmrE-like cation transporter